MKGLVQRLLDGDRRAAARLITRVENDRSRAFELMKEVYPHTGEAHIFGITGPPGVGKSTLIESLTTKLREKDQRVGIIAVDPTSPFTGGALLGDRLRMNTHSDDRKVFIRSMGTRGRLGGLSWATPEAIQILDAFGCDTIIVETVGAGQAEVDIMRAAHTSIVVEAPGLGDDIQAIKAGVMEIGEIFAVNKGDKEGADSVVFQIEAMLDLNPALKEDGAWRPPVVRVSSFDGSGMDDLISSMNDHRAYLQQEGRIMEKEMSMARQDLMMLMQEAVSCRFYEGGEEEDAFEAAVERIAIRGSDPYTELEGLLSG